MDGNDSRTLGRVMQELADHLKRRLCELEAIVGLKREQSIEREFLMLEYLNVQEEMKHLRK